MLPQFETAQEAQFYVNILTKRLRFDDVYIASPKFKQLYQEQQRLKVNFMEFGLYN